MVIGFVGAGVMARALAKGLLNGNVVSSPDLICSAPTAADGGEFRAEFPGARTTTDNAEVVRVADVTILAIKPQVFPKALSELREVSAHKFFLSIGAGMRLEKIRRWLHPSARLVRAMPNTPLRIGLGSSVYAAAPNATAEDRALAHRILAAGGRAWEAEEAQLDAVTALSGSGPAYVFHFINALACGGIELGLPPDLARDLAMQTVLGSAQLAAQSAQPPLELAAQVKSPRGTTLAGCAILEENDALNSLIARCLAAAKQRAEELARGDA